MKLADLLHASTRPGWTVRLVAYIAIILTLSLIVEVLELW